jgi:K+-sensing histidine kinase KdpD
MLKDKQFQISRYEANQMYYHFRNILDYSQIVNHSLQIFKQLCNLQDIIMHAMELHKI